MAHFDVIREVFIKPRGLAQIIIVDDLPIQQSLNRFRAVDVLLCIDRITSHRASKVLSPHTSRSEL